MYLGYFFSHVSGGVDNQTQWSAAGIALWTTVLAQVGPHTVPTRGNDSVLSASYLR